ncbi:adhesion regulating molecule [Lentinus tigrinus ALCF2SS1-7]|uniref:Adhesion regulating molecule n=1 Tax=Lentinus tigrinus ALCF2SS1-6 TaxID=1328759 RepID=A0A5C2SGG9_9APHY|nr:adhesion regulating molecule [Lentinus tigrinus ALCF2SS1-6]RPD77867.1 adhesion regulating molecule [Lentinus tigrinus ALCF2SS1-7]
MAETRLAFKAGRAFRRGSTNFVDPDPTKGAILLQNGEDGLLHFIWKNRSNNDVEEDLILFPGDATFAKVEQSAWGRTYVLKFSSSDQRHFFWMQDANGSRDEEFVGNVNRLLADPSIVPIWYSEGYNPNSQAAGPSTSTSAPAASSSQAPGSYQATPEELARIRQIVTSLGARGGAPAAEPEPEILLTDVLTPANLRPLFRSNPELVQSLFPHLPPDLPSPPNVETLERIVQSPQFRAAVRNLDMALRTGLLGGLVRTLGLPEEAGTGVEPFLRALQDQARREEGGGDRMETD